VACRSSRSLRDESRQPAPETRLALGTNGHAGTASANRETPTLAFRARTSAASAR
jgi:hypothetical protein